MKGVWADALGRFTGGTIAAAVRGLIDSGSQWPPTLPEFSEACRVACSESARSGACSGGTWRHCHDARGSCEILARIGMHAPPRSRAPIRRHGRIACSPVLLLAKKRWRLSRSAW